MRKRRFDIGSNRVRAKTCVEMRDHNGTVVQTNHISDFTAKNVPNLRYEIGGSALRIYSTMAFHPHSRMKGVIWYMPSVACADTFSPQAEFTTA